MLIKQKLKAALDAYGEDVKQFNEAVSQQEAVARRLLSDISNWLEGFDGVSVTHEEIEFVMPIKGTPAKPTVVRFRIDMAGKTAEFSPHLDHGRLCFAFTGSPGGARVIHKAPNGYQAFKNGQFEAIFDEDYFLSKLVEMVEGA